MYELKSIIKKIKKILAKENRGGKIFDKDVAKALDIPQTTFATMKKRNSIPFKEILQYCAKNRLSINWLFLTKQLICWL